MWEFTKASGERGGVRQVNDGAWLSGSGRRHLKAACVPIPSSAPSLDANPEVSFMILSSKKLPELWDYFLIYVSGALEFNPDSRAVDLGLFPMRMNPTIKTR